MLALTGKLGDQIPIQVDFKRSQRSCSPVRQSECIRVHPDGHLHSCFLKTSRDGWAVTALSNLFLRVAVCTVLVWVKLVNLNRPFCSLTLLHLVPFTRGYEAACPLFSRLLGTLIKNQIFPLVFSRIKAPWAILSRPVIKFASSLEFSD